MRTYQRFRSVGPCKVLAGLALAVVTAGANATAVNIKYLFNDASDVGTFANPGLDPLATIPAELSGFSAWTDTDGTLDADGLNGSGSPISRAVAATSWDDGNAFNFSFEVAAGSLLTISQIDFLQQGSGGGNGNGPTNWTMSINGNQVGSGTGTVNNPMVARSVSGGDLATFGTDLTGLVSFMIAATGASADTATWRIDDFVITGELTTVPVPAAAWLMATAMAGLAMRRRVPRRSQARLDVRA